MENKQIWRRFFLVLLAVFSIAYTVPTFVGGGAGLPEWYNSLFPNSLQYGLDLQGGLELRYTVDYKKAIKDNTNRLRDTLVTRIAEEAAREDGKSAEDMTKDELAPYREGMTTEMLSFSSFAVEFGGASAGQIGLLNEEFIERYAPGYIIQGSGGTTVNVFMNDERIAEVRDNVVAETLSIIRKRVDAFGLVEPDVRKSGEHDIDVQLPGVGQDQMDEVRKRIGQTAQLTFRIVDTANWFQTHQGKASAYKTTNPRTTVAYDDRANAFSARSKAELVDFVKTQLLDPGLVPDDHMIGYEFIERTTGENAQESRWQTRYLFSDVKLSGDYLTRALVLNDPQEGWFVSLEMNGEGGEIFGEVTTQHTGDLMAIMLDNDVNSAPQIREPILGGRARITMGGNRPPNEILNESRALVTVLNHGAYKAPVHKVHDHAVGPSLGADSINSGKMSLMVGGVLVIFFMMFYYRIGGVIANIALLFNVVLITTVLVNFGAALTLPGMAGLILTIGMAVDANVLIFERIREEIRAGRSARAAVEGGYAKAFWTIFDANITTALTGFILLYYTSGPIYGFAVVLITGIFCSVFTAYYVTRTIFDFVVQRGGLKTLSI